MRLLTLAIALLFVTLLRGASAQVSISDLDPANQSHFPLAYDAALPPAMAEMEHFTYLNLYLYGARSGEEDGWSVRRVRLRGDQVESEAAELPAEGLPEGGRLLELHGIPNASALAAAVELNGQLKIYKAAVAGTRLYEQWTPIPMPEPGEDEEPVAADQLLGLSHGDDYLMVFYQKEDIQGTLRTAGIAGDVLAAELAFEWKELPLGPRARKGADFIAFHDVHYFAGGKDQAGITPDTVPGFRMKPPQFENWETFGQPVFFESENMAAAAYSASAFVADRRGRALNDAEPTSATLAMATYFGNGRLSPWRELVLDSEPAPLAGLYLDTPQERLVLLEERGEELRLTGHKLPPGKLRRIRTHEEEMQRRKERTVVSYPSVGPERAKETSKKMMWPVIYIVAEESQDLNVRNALAMRSYNRMMAGVLKSYSLRDSETGQDVVDEFGITQFPAFIVTDHETGDPVARHEGSIPLPKEMFQLLAPVRSPKKVMTLPDPE